MYSLHDSYYKLIDLINQHLKNRGSNKNDYTYVRHEGEVVYVVRMCQQIADMFDLSYDEVRKIETYCSGHSDYSHKFALRVSQLVQAGGDDND